jgi:predicted RecA/RadA family phage recombinase
MKNWIQRGDSITVTAPGAIASGDLVAIGALVGVAADDAAIGETVAISTTGVFELPKAAGALDVGDEVQATAGVVEALDAGARIGVVVRAAGASDATVAVRLDG